MMRTKDALRVTVIALAGVAVMTLSTSCAATCQEVTDVAVGFFERDMP